MVMEFMDRGLCVRDPNPDAWHPHAGQLAAYAIGICCMCPVKDECLAYAVTHDLDGIWGGTRKSERDVLAGRAPQRTAYSPETRARAVAMFTELRPQHRSDAATHRAIAAELGITDHETVRRWREAHAAATDALGQAA